MREVDGGAESQGARLYVSSNGRKRDVVSGQHVGAVALDAPRVDQARMVLRVGTRSSQGRTGFEWSVGSMVQGGLDDPAWRAGIRVLDPCRNLDAAFTAAHASRAFVVRDT